MARRDWRRRWRPKPRRTWRSSVDRRSSPSGWGGVRPTSDRSSPEPARTTRRSFSSMNWTRSRAGATGRVSPITRSWSPSSSCCSTASTRGGRSSCWRRPTGWRLLGVRLLTRADLTVLVPWMSDACAHGRATHTARWVNRMEDTSCTADDHSGAYNGEEILSNVVDRSSA